MSKFTTKAIENAELSGLISAYLQADHTAKAMKEKADGYKAQILNFAEIDSANAEHYTVTNKNGKTTYRIEYKTRKAVKDETAAAKIAELKAQIKAIENEYSESEFWYFAMTEVKQKADTEE